MGFVKETEIPRPHGTEFSPLALYQFDQTIGVTVDSSGNGRTLTQTTAGTVSGAGVTGYTAISGGHYTRVDSTFQILGDISVAAIVKAPVAGTVVLAGYGGTSTGNSTLNVAWSLRVISGVLTYQHEVDVNSVVATNSLEINMPVGRWTHVAFTRTSGGTVFLYVNGSTTNSSSLNMVNIDSSNVANRLSIGRDTRNANIFTGQYKSIAIYGSVLTDSEILYLAKRTLRKN